MVDRSVLLRRLGAMAPDSDRLPPPAPIFPTPGLATSSSDCERMAERSMAPIISEIENPRRAWSASEDEAMAWAAHFWELRRYPAKFPSTFQSSLFERWIVALHLRDGRAPTARLVRAAEG